MYRCLDDVAKNVADLVLVDQDERLMSEKDFNLSSILYEFSSEFEENYVTVAVVKAGSSLKTFSGNFDDVATKFDCKSFLRSRFGRSCSLFSTI